MSIYGVELLYVHPPSLDKDTLLAAMRKRCPSARPLGENSNDGPFAFVHPDHLVKYSNGEVPAQTVIMPATKKPQSEGIEASLQQSWKFPEAGEIVAKCEGAVLVTDLMSSGLEPRERLDLFIDALLSVIDVAPPDAIYWMPAGQIVDPKALTEATTDAERFFAGAVNVRFFNIAGTDGDMLMDTLGLTPLGLTDFQCHFRELDPDDVARVLYNLAFYVVQNGDVIQDGHTVEGTEEGSKWRCRQEDSLVEPDRQVLDLDPGKPYAAGERG